jgi:hypothetical protein
VGTAGTGSSGGLVDFSGGLVDFSGGLVDSSGGLVDSCGSSDCVSNSMVSLALQ